MDLNKVDPKQYGQAAIDTYKNCLKKNENYESVKILKVPKTFSVPKIKFFNHLNDIDMNLKKKYDEKIDFIGQGIFSRHLFVKELLKKYE